MAFSEMLRKLRKQRHYTQEDLSKITGIAKSTISMYENGLRKPSYEVLESFADYFNVDMNTLMGKEEVKIAYQEKINSPLTAKEFLQILCKDDADALAVIERLELTQNGELKINGADLASQAFLDNEIRGLIAALKNARLTDDNTGRLQFEYTPGKERK